MIYVATEIYIATICQAPQAVWAKDANINNTQKNMCKHIHFIHQWQFSIRAAAYLSTRCDDGFIITNIMMKSDLHPIQFEAKVHE